MEPARDDALLGARLLLAGDVPGALAALTRAVDSAPFDVNARFNRAIALRLRGDLPAARSEAEAVLRLGARHASALAHAGLLAQLTGDLDGAIERYREALTVDPSHRVSRYYLGMALRLRGENTAAIASLERALDPGGAALPELVRERVRGQLHDALLAAPTGAPARATLCATSAVTEVMAPDDDEPRAASTLPDEPYDIAGREVDVTEAAALLHRAQRVVALTGAGLSVASGLHTRKDLWRVYDRDDAVSVARFRERPWALWTVVRDFLGDNRHAPNAAHCVIARLPRLAGVITQNVDDLHQRAAPSATYPIVELHGSLERVRCHACGLGVAMPSWAFVAPDAPLPPRCAKCAGPLRPDVVLFGEQVSPSSIAQSVELVLGCDLLLVVGCAMDVAPASELPRLAARVGATVLELKRRRSRITDAVGARLLRGDAATTLPAVYDALARLEALPPRTFDAQLRSPAPLRPSTTIEVPPLGESVVAVDVSRWLKRPGDVVLRDEPLVYVDSDKVTVEVPSPVAGVLRRQIVAVGETTRVGAALADIEPFAPDDPRYDRRDPGGISPAERRVTPDPIAFDFGARSKPARALLQELSEARWLAPDIALASRDSGAIGWLEERLDEHLGALGRYDGAALDGLTLRLWVTSDAREAHARWRDAWKAPKPPATSPSGLDAETRWNAALVAAQRWLWENQDLAVRVNASERREALQRATSVGLRRRGGLPVDELTAELLGPSWWLLLRAVCLDVKNPPPCPWRPLMEIWFRGAWPFALREGVLAVYVPIVDGDRIVVSPADEGGLRGSLTATRRPIGPNLASLEGFAWLLNGPAVRDR